MTLKKKLQERNVYINPHTFKLTKEGAENFEELFDEFAIGFADWLLVNDTPENAEKWFGYTNKDMLNAYKKEKGL
jgi:hypothetical protein